jgi:hypothetical protein
VILVLPLMLNLILPLAVNGQQITENEIRNMVTV